MSKHEWMQSCCSEAIVLYWIAQNYSIKTHIRSLQMMRVPFKWDLLFILTRIWSVQLFPSFHAEKKNTQLELYSSSSQVQEYSFESLNSLKIDYKYSVTSGLVEKGKKDTSEGVLQPFLHVTI